MDRGRFVSRAEAERTTVAELLDRYLREVTPGKASGDREALRIALLKRHFGVTYLANLTSRQIASYRDFRLGQGRAGATVVKELNTLSHAIDTGRRDWGIYLAENPVKLVRRPKTAPGRDRRLQSGELDRLLEACRTGRKKALADMVLLAIETGMRLGELLSLDWSHIDLQQRTAHLPHTKNGDARTVPLSSAALSILSKRRPESRCGRVFPHWSRATSFEHTWRRAVAKADLPNLRFHDLRHEAASRLFERGLHPIQVAAITGHRTLQMLKRYTHLKATDLALLLD
jgi:integrase